MSRWAPLASLLVLAGCCTVGTPPRDAAEALARVNDNLSKIKDVLYYPAFVSFSYRDADGRKRSIPVSDSTLFFRGPRDLLFQIKSAFGTIAEFGSNSERYWFWVEDRMWWGRWTASERRTSGRLPVRPDELADVLLLQPLPERLDGGLKPLLRIDGDDHRLLFVRTDQAGEAVGWREVRLQPHEPYQPAEIIDWLPDGRILMHARLERYKRVGVDGPFTARHYVVRWPQDGAELRLDITRARFRPDLNEVDFSVFPEQFEGAVEQIGSPPPGPGLSRAGSGGKNFP